MFCICKQRNHDWLFKIADRTEKFILVLILMGKLPNTKKQLCVKARGRWWCLQPACEIWCHFVQGWQFLVSAATSSKIISSWVLVTEACKARIKLKY